MALGACAAVPLAGVRQAAAAIMGDVARGRNPASERKEAVAAERAKRARNRLTLRVLIEDWNRLHLAGRRPSYASEAVRALHQAFAGHLDDAAEDLDRAAVVHALDAITRRHKRKDDGIKGAAMTGRTAAYGRAAFGWAVKRGALRLNPFADLPVAKSIVKRERVLSDVELAEIWRATAEASAPYGAIIRLLILTGQRRGEVAGMAWNEISEDFATWNLPAHRTKNGVAHTVPLSEMARDLLKGLAASDASKQRGDGFAGWSKSKRALDKAISADRSMAPRGGKAPAALMAWNVHDIRRTVATGLQRLGVRLEVTEALLNHISGSRGGIAGVYQRHDWASEKRAALDSWAAHVLAAIKQKPPIDKVITLTRKKR